MKIARANDELITVEIIINFRTLECMIAQSNHVCAAVENMLSALGSNAVSDCAVFAVDNNEIGTVFSF